MARKKQGLDSYSSQAVAALALVTVGALSSIAFAVFVFAAYNPELGIVYKAGSNRFYAIMASVAVAMAASGLGGLLGWNSAGQKTNTRSGLSWLAFFVAAAVLTLTTCIFVFFYVLRVPMKA